MFVDKLDLDVLLQKKFEYIYLSKNNSFAKVLHFSKHKQLHKWYFSTPLLIFSDEIEQLFFN